MHIGKWKIAKKDLVWTIICLVLLICFFIGIIIHDNEIAFTVLSGASTAISIVLSIVAILYTMIEGANAANINRESSEKLNQLNFQLEKLSKKIVEMNELKAVLNDVIPSVESVVESISATSGNSNLDMFDEKTRTDIYRLRSYISEDIDE